MFLSQGLTTGPNTELRSLSRGVRTISRFLERPSSCGRPCIFLEYSEDLRLLKIYVDADACPVKQEVYRVASRYSLDVILVANSWMRVPNEQWIVLEVVEDRIDAADDWIVEHVQSDDIVVTADIPLASRCLKKGVRVIGSTGKPFTERNIGQAIATRDLLSGLRDAGEITSGPPPLNKHDRSRFLQQLDEVIQSIRREYPFNST